MLFRFDKPTCQNIRKSLRKEWLETNGLGDYASSSMINCNTRRYHGLLVSGAGVPENRAVLLSTLEESLMLKNREFFFSCHKYPGRYYPYGHEYMYGMEAGLCPLFRYRFGDMSLTKELMMIPGRRVVMIRYSLRSLASDTPPVSLRIRPLLAYRHFHALARERGAFNGAVSNVSMGQRIEPCAGMPPLFMQVEGEFGFSPAPAWYYNVQYLIEEERGFDYEEDLFQPGIFDISLPIGKPVYFTASTEEFGKMFPGRTPDEIWDEEILRREKAEKAAASVEGHLAKEGERFILESAAGGRVIAGYHWFNVWGRDMLIALPGLTFCAGRGKTGVEILRGIGASVKDGLVPNLFSTDGTDNAYNSVDASLWYIWAVQQMEKHTTGTKNILKKELWPVIREIIGAYSGGKVPDVRMDKSGLLHVGTPDTQLTWMDAAVNGRPVTPRNGCPVEINSLWYNALAYAAELAERWNVTDYRTPVQLEALREEFTSKFWVEGSSGGYLADVWRESGPDKSLRPNQIFAVSLPHAILGEEYRAEVVATVRHYLLTSFGLRTLAPACVGYHPVYAGGPAERDGAYHQGTVWPWLLGAYAEALLRTTVDTNAAVRDLLTVLRPLFAQHLGDAGIGSISEIFDADAPHLPGGAIAQAWSVAECLRLLTLVKKAAPGVYSGWEASARKGG